MKQSMYIRAKYIILLLATILLTTGCEDDRTDESSGNNPGDNKNLSDAYVSVGINSATVATLRSSPNGGQEGDGSENGLANEDKINDVLLIFFEGNDLNSSLNMPVSEAVYMGSNNILAGNITKVTKVSLKKEKYNLLVFANVGNLSIQMKDMTVKEVCDYIQKKAWDTNGSTYTNFVMSSANEATIDLTTVTTEDQPATANVEVQRVAARIDIIPNQDNTYQVIDGSDVIGNITLNKVKMVNRLTAGSYLIRRASQDVTSAPNYLGKETPQSGNATNYVMDPWISLKTAGNLTGNHFDINKGGAGTSTAKSLYADYITDVRLNSTDNIKTVLPSKDFYILGYTFENTMDKDAQLRGYTTGVVYETTYIPTRLISYNPSSQENETITNADAVTFFSTNNTGNYNSLEALEVGFLNTYQENDFFSVSLTINDTWQDVKDYAARIKYNDTFGFGSYLNTQLAGKNLATNIDKNISWASYMLSTYGYSNNSNNITINQNGKNTVALMSDLGVKAYEKGLCYYPYWIRHSNNNIIESGIMEFGIVRNNIYKLKVVSFSGLGLPMANDPKIDDPDEESHIDIFIRVKAWNLILHPDIIM